MRVLFLPHCLSCVTLPGRTAANGCRVQCLLACGRRLCTSCHFVPNEHDCAVRASRSFDRRVRWLRRATAAMHPALSSTSAAHSPELTVVCARRCLSRKLVAGTIACRDGASRAHASARSRVLIVCLVQIVSNSGATVLRFGHWNGHGAAEAI